MTTKLRNSTVNLAHGNEDHINDVGISRDKRVIFNVLTCKYERNGIKTLATLPSSFLAVFGDVARMERGGS